MLKIRSLLFLFALSALCNLSLACVTPAAAPMLNSERIKQKFGSYGKKVIDSHSPNVHLSSLFSGDHDTQTCRTFAITMFESPMSGALSEGHRLVLGGQSIGSTFKDLGWSLSKENLDIELIESTYCLLDLMGLRKLQPLALHVYRLFVSKGEHVKLPYAIIAEIHHPAYLSLDEVRAIYGSVTSQTDLSPVFLAIENALRNLEC